MTYLSGRLRRLDPVPLPPPAMFIPPFSSDSSSELYDDELSTLSDESDAEEDDEEVGASSESLMSKLGNPRLSEAGTPYGEAGRNSGDSGMHEGHRMSADSRGAPTSSLAEAEFGGRESGYSSSVEDEG